MRGFPILLSGFLDSSSVADYCYTAFKQRPIDAIDSRAPDESFVVTRILIADDHDVVRSGIRSILEARPGWEIVAEAANGREAIKKTLETKPDVAVIDYSLPLLNGIEATRQIRKREPLTEVLIFTMHDEDVVIRGVLEAGARGYLLKTDAKQYLVAAVESLAAHKPFFTARVSQTLLASFLGKSRRGSDPVLSPREEATVKLIAEGHGNKEIAEVLTISLKTVESHRASALRKLNLSSTAELVRYAIRNKLVEL
jgi:DNA-binding NarL/FixJ family response regulator